MPQPTQKDILVAILERQDDLIERVGKVDAKVDLTIEKQSYTNGKVAQAIRDIAELKTDKIRRDEREKIASEMKSSAAPSIQADTVVLQQKWFQNEKLVGAVVAVLLALAALLGYFSHSGVSS